MSGAPRVLAPRLLVIDAAQPRAGVFVIEGVHVAASRSAAEETGLADRLAMWVDECLNEAHLPAASLDAIGVIVGPGSFTGLRASIALARGIGLAAEIPVHGLSMSEAFGAAFPALRRPLWIAIAARRGRVFLERDGIAAAFDEDDIPHPAQPIALAGDRAGLVAATLAARGVDVMLTDARFCSGLAMATAVRNQIEAGAPLPAAVPLYVDPPAARLPASGLRPTPR